MHNKLTQIIEKKQKDLILQKKNKSLSELKKEIKDLRRKFLSPEKFSIIAEVKIASPSEGTLGTQEEILSRVRQYEKGGADAISVITEKYFFAGSIGFVDEINQSVVLPILQKDFIIDSYQIYEAATHKADALLLIARLVDEKTLKEFVDLTNDFGITPIVEIYDEEDLEKAISTRTEYVAVNARDLDTFFVDINRACELLKQIPNSFQKLGFSGIHTKEDIVKYKNAGVNGVLMGTSLMKSKNVEEFMKGLFT